MNDNDLDFLELAPARPENPVAGRRGGAATVTGRRALDLDCDAAPNAPAADANETLVEVAAGTAQGGAADEQDRPTGQKARSSRATGKDAGLKSLSVQPAALPAGATKSVLDAALDIFDDDDGDAPAAAAAPPPPGSTLSRRKQQQLAESSRQQVDKYAVERELELDSLEELDGSGKLDLAGQIAEAPKVRQVQQVQGLAQLEDEKLRNLRHFISGSAAAGDDAEPAIDLSLLLGALLPEHLVREPDDVWDEELLLAKVAAELQPHGDSVGAHLGVQSS